MLKIQDYLEASSDATKRTRRVLLTMVVASTLTAAGILNSVPTAWKQTRLDHFKSAPTDKYITDLIGAKPNLMVVEPKSGSPQEQFKSYKAQVEAYEAQIKAYEARYEQMFAAVAISYTETNSVRIPFFGINFDINDLGVVSGLALVIILIWFRLCVRTEIENLNLAFTESRRLNQLRDLYHLLAMRQVMISPNVPGRVRRVFYWIVPMVFCLMPALAFGTVLVTDFATRDIGVSINPSHTHLVLTADGVWMVVIAWLTLQAFRRWLRLDHAWTWYWCEYLIVSDSINRGVVKQIGESGLLGETAELLSDALNKKLRGKKLEESVLKQLSKREEKDGKTYTYEHTADSVTVCLILRTNARGKLKSSNLTPNS